MFKLEATSRIVKSGTFILGLENWGPERVYLFFPEILQVSPGRNSGILHLYGFSPCLLITISSLESIL